MKKIIFASDLDNTLIHSYVHKREGDICIEYKNYIEQGYVTPKVHELIPIISEKCVFIPVTSRSIAQYLRIGYLKKHAQYALTSNGGRLLINLKEDEAWSKATDLVVKENQAEFTKIENVLSKDEDYKTTKMIDNSYYFCYVKDGVNPKDKFEECKKITSLNVELSKKKIYILPEEVDKGKSIKKVKEMLGGDLLVVAGDNSMDLSMLNVADIAIVPNQKIADLVKAPIVYVNDTELRFCDYVVSKLMEIILKNK